MGLDLQLSRGAILGLTKLCLCSFSEDCCLYIWLGFIPTSEVWDEACREDSQVNRVDVKHEIKHYLIDKAF